MSRVGEALQHSSQFLKRKQLPMEALESRIADRRGHDRDRDTTRLCLHEGIPYRPSTSEYTRGLEASTVCLAPIGDVPTSLTVVRTTFNTDDQHRAASMQRTGPIAVPVRNH